MLTDNKKGEMRETQNETREWSIFEENKRHKIDPRRERKYNWNTREKAAIKETGNYYSIHGVTPR